MMKNKKTKRPKEITVYDDYDVTDFIDRKRSKSLTDLGFKLPRAAPTTVISIRLPNRTLNAIRAYSSERDLPYQSVIKMFLEDELERHRLI